MIVQIASVFIPLDVSHYFRYCKSVLKNVTKFTGKPPVPQSLF